jgi:type I restriction-modification system DNA methylase subunit
MANDPPEVIRHMKVLRARYKHESYFDLFSQAFAFLLESAEEDWSDTIGEVYMEFGHPSKWGGQFFTPYPLAKMMSMMTASDIPAQVHERIKAACKADPLAQSILMTGTLLDGQEAKKWYFEKLIPAVALNVKQVTVNDYSCGSGVMFLAAASEIPRWMLDWGFVQFYGQDIDQTCVQMAQINMMLHGLNGYSMKCAVAVGEINTSDTAENLIGIPTEIFEQHLTEMEV